MATASPNPSFHRPLLRATPLSVANLPTIPPPLPKTRAPEREQETQRVCEWCGKSIPQNALKCSGCGSWRKDILKDRSHAITGYIISVGLAVIGGIFVILSLRFLRSAGKPIEDILKYPPIWVGIVFFAFSFIGDKMRHSAINNLKRKTGLSWPF